MLEALGQGLKNTLKKIAQAVFVNDRLIDELIRDIQRSLLYADVNVQLVFSLTTTIKERALKEKAPPGITHREHLIRIVYEELVALFGKERKGITLTPKKPFIIMLVGLFGSGKTTTIGKIGAYYFNRGYKIASVGLDVYRPAARKQLMMVSEKAHIDSFILESEKNPIKIWTHFAKEYPRYDILIVDTAGRDALNKDLITEIRTLRTTIQPDSVLLVISADIGQAAQSQAQAFHDACGVTGVIVTKLDGTAKGGGSLSACAATQAPIIFVGVGEKLEDIEVFNPEGFVGRLLGMGDLEALLEKTREAVAPGKAEELSERLMKGEFNFVDLYDQLQAMKKLGPLKKVVEMIPGMSSAHLPKEMLDVQEEHLQKWKFILDSCTKEELEDPELLGRERIERIAQGSGTSVAEVRALLKQYKQTKKIMKMMKGKNPEKIMKKFSGMKFKT